MTEWEQTQDYFTTGVRTGLAGTGGAAKLGSLNHFESF